MPMRTLRKRHYRKTTNRPTPPLTLTLYASKPRLGAGVHARYHAGMSASSAGINRDAWAGVLNRLIREHTKGKKAPFARLVGVDDRTLSRWLRSEVDVREENIRAVARAIDVPPATLLVAAGLYGPEELAAPEPVDPREDPVIRAIMADPRLTAAEREELASRQLEQMERDLQRRREEYEFFVRRRRQAS